MLHGMRVDIRDLALQHRRPWARGCTAAWTWASASCSSCPPASWTQPPRATATCLSWRLPPPHPSAALHPQAWPGAALDDRFACHEMLCVSCQAYTKSAEGWCIVQAPSTTLDPKPPNPPMQRCTLRPGAAPDTQPDPRKMLGVRV